MHTEPIKIDVIPEWRDYLGIPFSNHGRDLDGVDCWGLVTIIYRRELQIILPDYHERYRDAEHIRGIARAFQDHTGDEFAEVSLLNAEPTDCVVVEIRGLPIHVGVYVGDIDGRRSMLHTMEGPRPFDDRADIQPLETWLSSNFLEASKARRFRMAFRAPRFWPASWRLWEQRAEQVTALGMAASRSGWMGLGHSVQVIV